MAEAAKDIIWFRSILKELGYPQSDSTTLFEDNQSCIKIANSPAINDRTKHIDIRHHFLKELIRLGVFNLTYLSITDMLADILTKPLDIASFTRLRDRILGIDTTYIMTYLQK